MEIDKRAGGGVSGTDYPWKAINLPGDMTSARGGRKGCTCVDTSVQTLIESHLVDSSRMSSVCVSNSSPAPNLFFMSQSPIANVFGLLRCTPPPHPSLLCPPETMWQQFFGGKKQRRAKKKGSEMDDTALGIMGYM